MQTIDITIDRCFVDNIHAGKEFKKNKGPNENPKAIAFCIDPSASKVTITNSCGQNLEGKGGAFQVIDDRKKIADTLPSQTNKN